MNNTLEGYIYIYKCIIGNHSDVCKIGISKKYKNRLLQHIRTPYYGFVPYIEFTTGNPIATIFRVSDYSNSDKLIKSLFSDYQLSNFEIYNIDYDLAIEKLYNSLIEKNILLELIRDNYSPYYFLDHDSDNTVVNTNKADFELLKEKILIKYGEELPEKLLLMLKDESEFVSNCRSHYDRGNFIKFPGNKILDLNYNKAKRTEIINSLNELL